MKRLSLLLLTILFVHSISAQVVDYSMIERNANTDVKLTLKDSKSSKPISWASVYLIPAGDTTITHFALSDDRGDVLLEDVPVGKYELNAEIIGYNPHRKTYAIKSHWDAYDLGVIRMEENAEFLDAASVSAIGNPVTVKKDTIEFNASSFRVGENAMLEDLIKKMPGMKVEEDGSVTLNGEKIDKITVGGKTFFFNDPTAALKNLPAKLVDKIKVIDKTKDEAAGSGIVTKDDKEKVMDVELKEEYTEGWYGNAKLGGGSTLNPDNGNALIDDRGLLYNGNAMVTGYTEKDQVIFLGNAFNAIEPGADVGYYGSSGTTGDFSSLGGLNSTAQAGMNYNTSRIKGMESTLSVNYKNNGKVDKKISSRTSFQPEGSDVLTDGTYDATGSQNLVSASMEIKSKENDKYYLYIMPSASYSTEAVNSSNISTTSSDGSLMNSSEASTVSSGNNLYTNGAVYFGLKEMGKKHRALSFGAQYSLNNSDKNSHEFSLLNSMGEGSVKDLFYNTDLNNTTAGISMTYSEPLAKKWIAEIGAQTRYYRNMNIRDASNPDGTYNDYYSSLSDNRYVSNRGALTVQYGNDTTTVQFGVMADVVKNEVRARSMGVETITGKGEWLVNVSPFAYYNYEKDGIDLGVYYSGMENRPSASSMTPSLNISNPVQITAGNIYLKPQYTHYLQTNLSSNNREKFSYFSMYLSGQMTTRSTVQASWMDASGVRYAVPVTSKKPATTGYVYLAYSRPITKDRQLTFQIGTNTTYSGSTSYQATSRLAGLDLQSFDYNTFMDEFWGDASGDRFYSGQSGFAESRTNTLVWGGDFQLKYSIDKLDASLTMATSNRISKYSLDPTANLNNWTNHINANILYRPGKDWEIGTDLTYRFYHGYTNGFGTPEWRWNMNVSKSIKSVTLGLKVADILNQTRNLTRSVSAEYVQDTYTNILGRFFLFSVSFNFGKMNAKKNSNIESAMWNMM